MYPAGECLDLLADTQFPWDLITLLGEECTDCWLTLWGIKVCGSYSLAEPTLVPWRTEQLNCLDNSLLPLFLVSPVIKSFVSYANIYELANYCQCIYHKLNLGRSSQNKTEKEKHLARLTENIFALIFEWPVNRRLYTRGWRPSKRTSPNKRVYTNRK